MSRGSSNPTRRGNGKIVTGQKKTQRKSRARLQDAFAIASKQSPEAAKLPRNRASKLDDREYSKPAKREADDDVGVTGSKRGQKRSGQDEFDDEDVERGSDSEGNGWLSGEVDSEDDSELDSDEALGESDEERFQGFAFRGSTSTQERPSKKRRLSSPDENPLSEEVLEEHSENSDDEDEGPWEGFDDEAVRDGLAVSDVPESTGAEMRHHRTVDLADALDNGGSAEESETGSDVESDGSDYEGDTESAFSVSDEEHGHDNDPNKMFALQNLIESMNPGTTAHMETAQQTGHAIELDTPTDFGITSSRKLTVEDLLPSVTDPTLKKSLRLISSTGTAKTSTSSKGVPTKLEPPLARRQQDRLDRAAAYKKSKETLERWIDTIKHNRRADHIQFPMVGPDGKDARSSRDVLPRSEVGAPNELESTIQRILQESGLDVRNGDKDEQNIQALEEEHMRQLSVAEAHERRARLRMARELLFREEIRAKRLKKIKSKSFRRIHRKEREKAEDHARSALTAGGFVDLQEEQERIDRKRAEERMGARHRQSKWAKSVKAGGRQKWDEEARLGMTEMAQRDEILRRRIEGKPVSTGGGVISESSEDETSDADSDEAGPDQSRDRLRRRLDDIEDKHLSDKDAQAGQSRLSSMKFMQRAEAARKAENDAAVEQMRRELAGEDDVSDEGPSTIGRRKFQPRSAREADKGPPKRDAVNEFEEGPGSEDELDQAHSVSEPQDSPSNFKEMRSEKGRNIQRDAKKQQGAVTAPRTTAKEASKPSTKSAAGDGVRTSGNNRQADERDVIVDTTPTQTALKPALQGRKKGAVPRTSTVQADTSTWTAMDITHGDDTSDDAESVTDQTMKGIASLSQEELRRRAFAGDEVVASFEAEKEEMTKDEDDKVIDNTLPGWGHWIGDGVPKKSQARQKGKFLTKVEGVQKEKRADAKLRHVIISEKRIKKNAKYLAPRLPHPFESQQQYERSLRLPMGPEWTTRETFLAATKPRILVKQGIISPPENPFL